MHFFCKQYKAHFIRRALSLLGSKLKQQGQDSFVVHNSWVNLCVFGTGRYTLSLFTKIVMEKQRYPFICRGLVNEQHYYIKDTYLKDTVALK